MTQRFGGHQRSHASRFGGPLVISTVQGASQNTNICKVVAHHVTTSQFGGKVPIENSQTETKLTKGPGFGGSTTVTITAKRIHSIDIQLATNGGPYDVMELPDPMLD